MAYAVTGSRCATSVLSDAQCQRHAAEAAGIEVGTAFTLWRESCLDPTPRR
jgi:hypothetical protein